MFYDGDAYLALPLGSRLLDEGVSNSNWCSGCKGVLTRLIVPGCLWWSGDLVCREETRKTVNWFELFE